MRQVFAKRYLDSWFLLVMTGALLLAFWIVEPAWMNGRLIQSLIAQNAPLALVAMAMTFSIISRHIDLSPGSMIGLSGAVIGLVYTSTGNIAVAILAGFGVAIGVNLLHALLVAGWGLNTIMITLGAYIWARGLTLGANNGSPIVVGGGLPNIVNASVGGLTLTAPLVLAAYIGGWYLLARTKMGRYTYAIGGDPIAARRVGIKVGLYTTLIFVLMGTMVAVAAVVTVGQLGSAAAGAGTGLELDAIIAVVIGGSRLAGGEGNVGRTAMGVVFLSILNSGLLNLGLTDADFQLYRGVALLSVLAVQVWLRRVVEEEERRRNEQAQLAAEAALA